MNEETIQILANRLTDEIQHMGTYKNFYNAVLRLVCSPKVIQTDFKNSLIKMLKETGMEIDLRNTIYHWLNSHKGRLKKNGEQKEPLAYLRRAQFQWEKRIIKSLNSMATEINVPLAEPRSKEGAEQFQEKWNVLGSYEIDLSQYRPVYAPKDFLDMLLYIRNPNYHTNKLNGWEFVYTPLKTKTLSELKDFYYELSLENDLLGFNPNQESKMGNYETLLDELIAKGDKVLALNHAPVSQEFVKCGCPRGLRPKLWAQIMGVQIKSVKSFDVDYYEKLKKLVLQYDLMIDKLIFKDVQLTAANDHHYFVFEDLIYQVLLCFSRDTDVLMLFNYTAANPIHGTLKGKSANLENTVVYPPCGIIPFHGLSMFVAPFCYLYDSPVVLYYIFKSFYLKYWFRLHEVSSDRQSILSLCLLFERLLLKHEQKLWFHLKKVGIQPIRLVFKWIHRGFSGFLLPDQLLYLWDIVISYDSLEVLAVLSAAIISFRKRNLLVVNTLQQMESILADLSSIAVVPLLHIVFQNKKLNRKEYYSNMLNSDSNKDDENSSSNNNIDNNDEKDDEEFIPVTSNFLSFDDYEGSILGDYEFCQINEIDYQKYFNNKRNRTIQRKTKNEADIEDELDDDDDDDEDDEDDDETDSSDK